MSVYDAFISWKKLFQSAKTSLRISTGTLKSREWTSRDLTTRHQIAGVDITNFEEPSAAGFQHVYPDASVAGCWFHYAQAIIIKRINKIGLKEAYESDEDVQNVVQCLVSLPLLPPEENNRSRDWWRCSARAYRQFEWEPTAPTNQIR